MKIALIGATGRTGRYVQQRAIARGHHVTAIVRTPEPFEQSNRLTIIRGDIFDPKFLAESVSDHDAVISTLARGKQTQPVLTDATLAMLGAIKQLVDPPNYIVISQGLLFESKDPVVHLIRHVLKETFADSLGMETHILASSIDWTIVRPPRLTIGGPVLGYTALGEARPSGPAAMNRADLAEFLIDEAEMPKFSRKIVGITSRQKSR